VLLGLLGAQALRAVRDLKRLASRVEALADLPVVTALERADAEGRRIEAAVAELPVLLERAKAAVVVIRRGPLPAELFVAIARVRAEIAAFRKFAGR
jgi:predicted TIM-barrel enzyme